MVGHFGGGLHSQSLDWYWQTKQYRKINIQKLNTNTVQESKHAKTKYKSDKVYNLKNSKTKQPWFSRLLRHSARKRGGPEGMVYQYIPRNHDSVVRNAAFVTEGMLPWSERAWYTTQPPQCSWTIMAALVLFFFTPGRNRSCPGSLKTVLFQRPGKKYRVLNHARFYPVLPERTRVKSVH